VPDCGAARAGLTNVETLEADGEALGTLAEGAFDAVISRLGLIYSPTGTWPSLA
jgi:hypothetical protein